MPPVLSSNLPQMSDEARLPVRSERMHLRELPSPGPLRRSEGEGGLWLHVRNPSSLSWQLPSLHALPALTPRKGAASRASAPLGSAPVRAAPVPRRTRRTRREEQVETNRSELEQAAVGKQ